MFLVQLQFWLNLSLTVRVSDWKKLPYRFMNFYWMRCRSWGAANESGSPRARLTINTAAEGSCSQHLPEGLEGLLPPAGLVLLGMKTMVLPIPWSRQGGVGCVALCPWASIPPYPWGREGQYYALPLVKKNQIWREKVFESSACNVRENLMSAVQGRFLDWCWVYTSFAMPVLVNSPLGTIHRQRLSGRACSSCHGRIL